MALLLTAGGTSLPSRPSADAADRYTIKRQRVAPGVRLLKIRDRRGPNQIRVLKLNPSSSYTLRMELAHNEIPDHERTSSMAARNGALAAINGDYTLLPSDPAKGRPVHTFAQEAELVTSPLLYGRNFALTADEQQVYIGHPKFTSSLTQQETGESWTIHSWNKVPARFGEITAYTVKGGWNHKPPRDACSSRLMPADTPALQADQVSVAQTFTVALTKCASKRVSRRGGVVVSALRGSSEAALIQGGLVAGETVTLAWSTGWPGVVETIGGNPTLLEDGVITAENCTNSYFCERNPRTGIGVNSKGKILMVTVDGRRKRSVGMKPVAFAKLFRWLGATSALNLDGGGSTTMWVRGSLVNKPSGASERPVGSSVLIVPEAPEPEPSPSPTLTPLPDPTEVEALSTVEAPTTTPRCTGLRDPGSTGGILDYLARRNGLTVLDEELRRALAVYRGKLSCKAFTRAR